MKKLFVFEKMRFVIAGCFNTGLDFIMLNFLVLMVGLSPLLANTVSVCIGVGISYLLNHFFVFQSTDRIRFRKFIHFALITGFSSLIIQSSIIYGFGILTHSDWGSSLFLIKELSDHHTIELNIAKALAVALGMVWNYILYKYIIFKSNSADIPDEVEVEIKKDA